jgi:hypothetical protein
MFTYVRPIHKQKMLGLWYHCAGVRLAALCFQHFSFQFFSIFPKSRSPKSKVRV